MAFLQGSLGSVHRGVVGRNLGIDECTAPGICAPVVVTYHISTFVFVGDVSPVHCLQSPPQSTSLPPYFTSTALTVQPNANISGYIVTQGSRNFLYYVSCN